MRRAIFIFSLAVGCSNPDSKGGNQGNADFSFAGTTIEPADKPLGLGTDATLRVHIDDATLATKATFDSSAPAVLQIAGTSRGFNLVDWFVVVHAASEGKSTISVGDGAGKIIDTFDLSVAAISKLDIPASADLNVGQNKQLDVTPHDAKGDEVYAPNVVSWSVDHPEIAQFWNLLHNAPEPTTSGTSVVLHGMAVGTATLHGAYGKTLLTVPVTVK